MRIEGEFMKWFELYGQFINTVIAILKAIGYTVVLGVLIYVIIALF